MFCVALSVLSVVFSCPCLHNSGSSPRCALQYGVRTTKFSVKNYFLFFSTCSLNNALTSCFFPNSVHSLLIHGLFCALYALYKFGNVLCYLRVPFCFVTVVTICDLDTKYLAWVVEFIRTCYLTCHYAAYTMLVSWQY